MRQLNEIDRQLLESLGLCDSALTKKMLIAAKICALFQTNLELSVIARKSAFLCLSFQRLPLIIPVFEGGPKPDSGKRKR